VKGAVRVGVAVLLALYLAVVATRNTEPVNLDFWFSELPGIPSWLALASAVLLGAALGSGALAWPLVRLGLRSRQERRRIEQLEQEIHGLRTLPLGDELRNAGDDPGEL
jgi:uncharacterized integral membrane protein